MSTSITVIHVQGQEPSAVEQALESIFAGEERARRLRIEGTFSACLSRLDTVSPEASYRYMICRPPAASSWTPVLELGNRTDGLELELSRGLHGAAVFTVFVYGDLISGYRLARSNQYVDRYTSDPSVLQSELSDSEEPNGEGEKSYPDATEADYERERGHPERFADLLPAGTSPKDFTRIVLRPGWWEEAEPEATGPEREEDEELEEELEDVVDETDRMRCIALALELWGPTEYPFAQDAEDIPNKVGPAIARAFA
jgi:hypothetical protein